MSYDIAISIENISKCFHMYEKPLDRLKHTLFRGKKKFHKEFWALNDVSFKINKGETIGIIGKNGSGKSTLLQIIANTLTPTSGKVSVNGRVAALLELGSGFNPEFTGRENAIMNGTIMGLNPKEIQERMPLIEEFADIGEFIDQPIKTYSSGMFVRLAFACAINVDPDILIVDEALAVGDMQFQLKCIDKMKTFKKEGKTILFVSHDSFSVRNFCDQAIWMMDGQVHVRGDANTVTKEYEDHMKYGLSNLPAPNIPDESIDYALTIDQVRFLDADNKEKNNFLFGEQVKVKIDYTLKIPVEGMVGGIALFDKQNTYICGLNTKLDGYNLEESPGKYSLVLSYENLSLLPGTYFIDVGFFESSALVRLDYKSRVKSFRVMFGDYFAEGITYFEHKWNNER